MTYAAKPHNRAASAVLASVFAVLLITEPGAIDFDSSTAYIKQDHVGEYWLCIQNEQPIKLTEDDVNFYKQLNFQIIKEHS